MLQRKLSLVLLRAYFDMYSCFDIYLILGILFNNTYTDTMNRRHASSSFSTPEPKCQDLPLHIVIDDLHDLFSDGLLSPLTPLEDSPDVVSRDKSSLFSNPEPKHQDLPLHIVVDDLDDLFNGGPLSPLTPLEDSSDEVSDKEVPPSFKWCRQAKHGWMLLGKDEDKLSGISWKSTLIEY